MPRKKHLEQLHQYIRENANKEESFDSLYTLLLEEFQNEQFRQANPKQNIYLLGLKETKGSHAQGYLIAKGTEEGWDAFRKFVTHFEQDVAGAISRIKS